MTFDPYRRIAPWYDRVLEPFDGPLRATAMRFHVPAENARVLDVGCGTGATLAAYSAAGYRCTGIDMSEAMIEQAHKAVGDRVELTLGDARSLPYEDAAFDLVLASLFLHELSGTDRDAVLREMARTITLNGRALVVEFASGELTFKGQFSRGMSMILERVAGKDHKHNCVEFLQSGGLPAATKQTGLVIENVRIVGGGNMGIYILKRAGGR